MTVPAAIVAIPLAHVQHLRTGWKRWAAVCPACRWSVKPDGGHAGARLAADGHNLAAHSVGWVYTRDDGWTAA